jgi:hypothetical protein
MQHLRFANGTERNLLSLHDLWKHQRMLIAVNIHTKNPPLLAAGHCFCHPERGL